MLVSIIILILIAFYILYQLRKKQIICGKNKYINGNIIATITHDLKTPAIAQIRALELLLKGNFGEVNDSQKLFIKDIINSCSTMLDMLMNMLWLYKFDNNKVAVNKINFCINDLISEIINENKLLLSSRNQKFNFNNHTAKIYISADKMHIKRIIFNLLVNAITHANEHSVINIETTIVNNKFIFIVRSQGKYIPDEMLDCIRNKTKVFAQKSDGLSTGLGLYLSNSLLELNGGKFICQSSKDGANRFGFSIDLNKKNKIPFYQVFTKQLIKK